ncbi:hypothetical protein QL285_086084 [Trifolium repens]|nr:hypothetical protein QL285_086084 [Trifolium repens]
MDHSWMYDRVNPNRFGFKDSFFSGVGELVNKAMEQPQILNHGEITCPCVNCKCIDLKMPSEPPWWSVFGSWWFPSVSSGSGNGVVVSSRGQVFAAVSGGGLLASGDGGVCCFGRFVAQQI